MAKFSFMIYHFITNKFTLIPFKFFSLNNAVESMNEMFTIEEGEAIKHIRLKQHKAEMVYSIPYNMYDEIEGGENELESEIYPLSLYLLDKLNDIKDYNKVIFHYSKEKSIAHIVISKGDVLQLINTYNSNTFEDAVYFLFLAIKQTIINPQQTHLQVYSNLEKEEIETLENYFSSVNICNLDSKINIL